MSRNTCVVGWCTARRGGREPSGLQRWGTYQQVGKSASRQRRPACGRIFRAAKEKTPGKRRTRIKMVEQLSEREFLPPFFPCRSTNRPDHSCPPSAEARPIPPQQPIGEACSLDGYWKNTYGPKQGVDRSIPSISDPHDTRFTYILDRGLQRPAGRLCVSIKPSSNQCT